MIELASTVAAPLQAVNSTLAPRALQSTRPDAACCHLSINAPTVILLTMCSPTVAARMAPRFALCLLMMMWIAAAATPANAQDDGGVTDSADLIDRPIGEIRIVGLRNVDEQLVRNQIRSAVGDPYDPQTARLDVSLLYRLGRFDSITAVVEPLPDGTVRLTFNVEEQPLITEIVFQGNRLISNEEIRASLPFTRLSARDDFQIRNAIRAIQDLYREKGHYLTTVTINEAELAESGVLIFRINEGPRVRVKAIEFEFIDKQSYEAKTIRGQIDTKPAVLFFRKGKLDEDVLARDVATIDSFYKDRGYLDVRVDSRIDISPDNTEAKVTFLISEGQQYTLRSLRAETFDGEPLQVFSLEQIASLLTIKPGDVYSQDKIRRSIEIVRNSYELLGYLDVSPGTERIIASELRTGESPEVDLVLRIDEGRRYRVGIVRVGGNFLTREKVIMRQVTLKPGRPLDATQIEATESRLNRLNLFNEVRITVQPPDPQFPDTRDILIEVKERNTGSVNFGAAIGSDAGIFGTFSLVQSNFDITDTPESFDEFIRGRAFRGAGQSFSLVIAPGNEVSEISISLTEPYFRESDYSLTVGGSLRLRDFDDYNENRLRGNLRIGRRLGEVWNLGVIAQFNRVELEDIDADAATAVFQDAGPENYLTLGVDLVRTTARPFIRPTQGSRLEMSLEQVGLLGGDFNFTRAQLAYTSFFTLREDFLGRKSILKLDARFGYLIDGDDAPVYEAFYLGGQNFRGFEFRGIGPVGIANDTGNPSDNPIGGEWLMFLGAEYEFPIAEEFLNGVIFIDTGTVTNDIGVDDYRVSVGAGVRLYLPALGPVPISVDLGFPIVKEDTDEENLITFGAALPF